MLSVHRNILISGLSGLFAMVVHAGCAGQATEDDGDETSPTSKGAGGSSAGGGNTGGNAQGGAGGVQNLCGTDCSGISAPQCFESVCNEGMHPGPVGACVIVPVRDGARCDDGAFCTLADTCVDGVCTGGPPNDCGMTAPDCQQIACDEDNDACAPEPGPNGAACIDPTNLCIKGATCLSGQCAGGMLDDCFFAPVPDDCHVALCNPINGMCEPVAGNEGGLCIDTSDLCTINKTCAAGVCVGGVAKNCSHLTMGCDLGVCDTTTGQCTTQTVMDGQSCDDLDACTTGEICTTGNCGGGTPVTTCSLTADDCCPSSCTETSDIDCACGLDKIRILEVYIGGVDYAILGNPSTCALDIDPLQIVFDDSSLTDVFYEPPSFVLAAGAQVVITESGSPPPGGLSTGTNILFSGTRGGAVVVCDGPCNFTNGANVIDALPWEGAQLPPPLPAGITFTPMHASGITGSNEATTSHLRIAYNGTHPNFFLADWTTGPKTQ
jgi:hypothetical protein